MSHLQLPRWSAVYEFPAVDYEAAKDVAHGIAVEQTIEYPYELVTGTWFAEEMTGQILDLQPAEEGFWTARISYPSEAVQGEFVQLLNMLYGNSSLQPGVRVLDFSLNEDLLADYPGPKFGIAGLRKRWHAPSGPLLMAVIKPIGHTTAEFADMVYRFALAGVHTVKDDHSLHNQCWSPFRARVKACVEAVRRAADKTGKKTAYLANVMADGTELLERAFFAQEAGADGVMLSPSLAGWSMLRQLSADPQFQLPIILHPSYSGAFIRSHSIGMDQRVYNGYLPRLAGADGVIFTGFGGRFSFPTEECLAAQQGCLSPWHVPPILPCAGGGVHRQALADLHRLYGDDIMLLVGGDLFRPGPDLTANARSFLAAAERIFQA